MLGKTSESEVSSHLYDLIYELNQVAPNVLFAVLPQLEFKLKVDMGCNDSHDFYKCQVLSQRDRAIVCVCLHAGMCWFFSCYTQNCIFFLMSVKTFQCQAISCDRFF